MLLLLLCLLLHKKKTFSSIQCMWLLLLCLAYRLPLISIELLNRTIIYHLFRYIPYIHYQCRVLHLCWEQLLLLLLCFVQCDVYISISCFLSHSTIIYRDTWQFLLQLCVKFGILVKYKKSLSARFDYSIFCCCLCYFCFVSVRNCFNLFLPS